MQSPPMTLILHYQMEASQQEGLLGTSLSQAIKSFNCKKLAMAVSTVKNTEYKCSVIEKEFEKNLKPGLPFSF